MTERRRPAAASRILAAGLSAAATLGLTAGMAAAERAVAPGEPPGAAVTITARPPEAPRRVVVLIRRHQAPVAVAAAPSRQAPAAARPARARPRPVTRTRGS